MITSIQELEEKLLEFLEYTQDVDGNLFTDLIKVNNQGVRLFIGDWPELVDRDFPCIYISLDNISIDGDRLDSQQYESISIDTESSPPIETYRRSLQPIILDYQFRLYSRKTYHDRELVTNFMANWCIDEYIELDEGVAHCIRQRTPFNFDGIDYDQKTLCKMFPIKMWTELQPQKEFTEILIGDSYVNI